MAIISQAQRTTATTTNDIGAFLFDVDGVIADTAPLHTAAWAKLAAEEGWPFDSATAESLRGVSREESLRRILKGRQLPAERFAELTERKNAFYLEALARLTAADVLPGVLPLMDDLSAMGVKRAAVSASRNARTVLANVGIAMCLDAIIDGEDEANAASGLHRYLLAAAAMRVAPARCVVVEDAAAGVALARAAGMRCIGVGDSGRLCAATMVFESLRGVDARMLLAWLAPKQSPTARDVSCRLPLARV